MRCVVSDLCPQMPAAAGDRPANLQRCRRGSRGLCRCRQDRHDRFICARGPEVRRCLRPVPRGLHRHEGWQRMDWRLLSDSTQRPLLARGLCGPGHPLHGRSSCNVNGNYRIIATKPKATHAVVLCISTRKINRCPAPPKIQDNPFYFLYVPPTSRLCTRATISVQRAIETTTRPVPVLSRKGSGYGNFRPPQRGRGVRRSSGLPTMAVQLGARRRPRPPRSALCCV